MVRRAQATSARPSAGVSVPSSLSARRVAAADPPGVSCPSAAPSAGGVVRRDRHRAVADDARRVAGGRVGRVGVAHDPAADRAERARRGNRGQDGRLPAGAGHQVPDAAAPHGIELPRHGRCVQRGEGLERPTIDGPRLGGRGVVRQVRARDDERASVLQQSGQRAAEPRAHRRVLAGDDHGQDARGGEQPLHEGHLHLDGVLLLVHPVVPRDVGVGLHQRLGQGRVDRRHAERRAEPGALVEADAVEARVGVVGAENDDGVVAAAGGLREAVGRDLAREEVARVRHDDRDRPAARRGPRAREVRVDGAAQLRRVVRVELAGDRRRPHAPLGGPRRGGGDGPDEDERQRQGRGEHQGQCSRRQAPGLRPQPAHEAR